MPEFLAETYTPRLAAAPCAGDVARAAAPASGPQAPVRFLGAITVPEEETCFWLYQAPSAAAVRGDDRRRAAARTHHRGRGGPATDTRARRAGHPRGPAATRRPARAAHRAAVTARPACPGGWALPSDQPLTGLNQLQ